MAKTVEAIWASCLEYVKSQVSEQSFRTWFEPIRPVKLNNNVISVQVPSQFFYEWLEEHYVSLLRTTIVKELGEGARLEYQVVVDKGADAQNPYTVNMPARPYTKTAEPGANGKTPPNIKNPFVIPGIKDIHIDSQLNVNYTFDSYVEGDCNQLARSAGIAVAASPGTTSFNPLVLFGGVGLGKTHLAHAIGNRVKEQHRDKTVLCVTSEKYTNQFIEAVKTNSINDFMNFYQLVDVLIVDDIQFFAKKHRTQDIFFHTFNALHQTGKQLVLTCDRPPRDLVDIEERLLSRFKWGLTADLQVPDYETRIAILEKKLYKDGIEIPRDVVEYIAYHIATNVRELEGALISLMAQSSLTRKEIDLRLAKIIVKSIVVDASREITIELIQKVVGEYFNISVDALKGKTRKRDVVQARQVSMYLTKHYTGSSLKIIGKHFGNRDHSTVIHACRAVENLMETDPKFQREVDELQKQLKMEE